MIDIKGQISNLKSAIDIIKIIINSEELLDKAEIKLRLTELINSITEAKIKINEMKEALEESNKQKKELQKKLFKKENTFFESPYYLIKKENNINDGPFCQVCYDTDIKLCRLNENRNISGQWNCLVCNNNFYDKNYDYNKNKKDIKYIKSIL